MRKQEFEDKEEAPGTPSAGSGALGGSWIRLKLWGGVIEEPFVWVLKYDS